MPENHSGRRKPTRHEFKPGTVVPFRRRTAADRERHLEPAIDPYRWFRFRLSNGFTGAVPILERDLTRILRRVQGAEMSHPFAVFDTPTRRIGLNLRHTACSQFDGHLRAGLLADALPDTDTVDIIFSDSKEPLRIEVEPDEFAISDGDYGQRSKVLDDDATAALVQVAMLFSYCEFMHTGSDHVERLQDVCCSSIWIRLNDVALLSAPLGHIKARRRTN